MDGTNHATVGCTFSTDAAAIGALRALADAGLNLTWRVGAVDTARAIAVAGALGARADLDPADPLAGVAGIASRADASRGVDTGALAGAIAGAAAGFAAASYTAIGTIIPVAASARPIAGALLFFAVGAAVGGVLGGALGAQSSTHAGFRLVDAMEAGDVAALATLDRARTAEATRLLREHGASEIVVIGARA